WRITGAFVPTSLAMSSSRRNRLTEEFFEKGFSPSAWIKRAKSACLLTATSLCDIRLAGNVHGNASHRRTHQCDEGCSRGTSPEIYISLRIPWAVAHFGGLVHACYEKVEEGAVRNLQKEKDDGRD